MASQVALVAENPPATAADLSDEGSIPEWGGSPGRGQSDTGNPLQYPRLENPWTEEPGELQSRHTRLSTDIHTFYFIDRCCF